MQYYFVFGGAIGDALLGLHLARVLRANKPDAQVTLLSLRENPFVGELLASVDVVTYRELPKEKVSSWCALAGLALVKVNSVVYEPTSASVPAWWAVVLWCLRARGGVQVRYHMHGHERPVPPGTVSRSYVCQAVNHFDAVDTVVEAWGVPVTERPHPTLPIPTNCPAEEEPYLLFHFFAGQYRRSFPVDKSRSVLVAAREQFPRHQFVLTCTNEEADRARRMVEGIANVTVEASLPAHELTCKIYGADLTIGVASGITQIAAHLGKRSVVLCNLSDPCWLQSFDSNSILLYDKTRCGCNGDKTGECNEETPEGQVYRCLYDITPERILDAMQESLAVST